MVENMLKAKSANKDTAVLLLNMGGPHDLDDVYPFLRRMFNDVSISGVGNGCLRNLLSLFIARSRVNKSKEMYKVVGGGSPISRITSELVGKLNHKDPSTLYCYAMRYVPPFASETLEEIKKADIKDIILFSMYPQYSYTTSSSSLEDATRCISSIDFKPKVHIIDRYFNEDMYIKSVAHQIQRAADVAKAEFKDENGYSIDPNNFTIIYSSHSIPMRVVAKGDKYGSECETSKTLIDLELKARGIHFKKSILAYQSKLGPVKWLGPNLKSVLKELKGESVIIYPLSFTVDNIETVYELEIQCRELAHEHGISNYMVCSCLNHCDDFVNLIIELKRKRI